MTDTELKLYIQIGHFVDVRFPAMIYQLVLRKQNKHKTGYAKYKTRTWADEHEKETQKQNCTNCWQVYTCVSLCMTVTHNIKHDSSDNLPFQPPDKLTALMQSTGGEEKKNIMMVLPNDTSNFRVNTRNSK